MSRLKRKNTFQLFILLIILVSFPLILIIVKQTMDNRSSAAAADKLETEGGTLGGNATFQTDTQASGGQYVALGINQANSPTPVPTTPPQSGAYGPRPAPTTPTGSNVYVMPNGNGIDLSGATVSSTGVNNWISTIPNGTAGQYNIIVIPSGSTLRIDAPISLNSGDRYLTFWMYGATINKVGNVTSSGGPANTFLIQDSDNIRLLGGRINGGNTNGGTTTYGNEQGHGISLWSNTDDIEIADMTLSRQYSDGIYFSGWNPSQHNRSHVHHNLIEYSGRQNITPNGGGDDTVIEYNILREPELGNIDWEDMSNTNPPNQTRNRQTIRNNWFDGWMWYGQGGYGYTPSIQGYLRNSQVIEPWSDITIENNLFTKGWMGYAKTSAPCPTDVAIIEFSQRWQGSPPVCGYTAAKRNVIVRNNTFNLPNGNGGRCETQTANRRRAVKSSNTVNLTITNNNFQGMTIDYAAYSVGTNSNGCGPYSVPASTNVNVSGNQ